MWEPQVWHRAGGGGSALWRVPDAPLMALGTHWHCTLMEANRSLFSIGYIRIGSNYFFFLFFHILQISKVFFAALTVYVVDV